MTAPKIHRIDLVMSALIAFLTPMLLATTGGDQAQARATAIQAVNAYAARNPAELLLIGQSIALGLAVLSSISLSMAENIPIKLILRLRSNATSLHRAAEQCRRALGESGHQASPAQEAPLSDIDLQQEAENIAEAARTRQRVNDYQTSFAQAPATPHHATNTTQASPRLAPAESPHSPASMKAAMAALQADSARRIAEAGGALATGQPIPIAPSQQLPMTEDEYFRAAWSSAMADVADEMTAEIPDLPPAERKAANIRVAALNATASQIVSGPPSRPT